MTAVFEAEPGVVGEFIRALVHQMAVTSVVARIEDGQERRHRVIQNECRVVHRAAQLLEDTGRR